MLPSKIVLKEGTCQEEALALAQIEADLGEHYDTVRHSLLARGLVCTLADPEIVPSIPDGVGPRETARLKVRFTLGVINLSAVFDALDIDYPKESEVLLVEDDPNDEELARKALARIDPIPHIELARNGEEALERIHGGQRLPDLILLDLKIPRVSGLEVLKAVRSCPRTSRLPVVVVSSSDEEGDVQECNRLGISAYVRKPVDYNEYLTKTCATVAQTLHLAGVWMPAIR